MKRWLTKSLAALGSVADGDWILKENYTADGVRLIQVGDVGEGEFIGKSNRYISLKRAKELQCSFLKAGDILISRMPDPLGRACIFPGLDCPAITAVDVTIFRSESNKAHPQFIKYFLNSSPWFDEVLRYATGTTRPRISRTQLEQMEVPVPPLTEQERIVKLLDVADELRKLRAQADRRTAALIPALFHGFFGDETSESRKSLDEVCLKITDGVHITPTYVNEGVPFLRVTDIQDEEIEWSGVKRIPQSEYEQITRRVKPEMGDILYSKNGTIGIAKEVNWERPFTHFVSLALIKPNRTVLNSTFLTTWLNTPDALSQAVGRSKTGTVTNLHLNEIKKMRVPCPPMEIQVSFVKRVNEIRELQTAQFSSRQRLNDLFQSMLYRAFNGEL